MARKTRTPIGWYRGKQYRGHERAAVEWWKMLLRTADFPDYLLPEAIGPRQMVELDYLRKDHPEAYADLKAVFDYHHGSPQRIEP
jgi:hypothetical protein